MLEIDKIYNEDCLIGMQRIPDCSVDCIITDLPYGTIACAWDSIIPFDKLWEQYKRIIKPQGVIALFGSEPFSTMLRMSNLEWFKYDWIWSKNRYSGFVHAKNMPLKDFEIISVFSPASMGHANLLGDKRMTYNPQDLVKAHKVKTGALKKFGGVVGKRPSQKDTVVSEYENYPTATLFFDVATEGFHPTQKPVDLIRYLIRTYSNEGDLILDSTCGSGTTCVAAVREKRHFIGFELTEEYYNIACKRVREELQQPTLF